MSLNKDELNIGYIREHIDSDTDVDVRNTVTSTNTLLKEYAISNKERKSRVMIASRQTSGRGSKGRTFFSPEKSGIYVSILLYPSLSPEKSLRLTTAAALGASIAIKKVTGIDTDIKWVNDIYKNGRKLCGILCEASLNNSGELDYAIVGTGFNIMSPAGGFPDEIKNTAGAIYSSGDNPPELIREKIACEFVNTYFSLYKLIESDSIYEGYKSRLFIIGKKITVFKNSTAKSAIVLDLKKDFSLSVRYDDGIVENLSYGEISIKL